MKTLALSAVLTLAACGSAPKNEAASAQDATSTDAVTAEAVRDTQAAEADAMKAADAELDNLGNSIGNPAAGDTKAKSGDGVSRTTKVEVY